MKHPSSREMFRYWTMLRGRRPAPSRDDIDPAALRKVLGDSFILSFEPHSGHPIQLAGTRVCALFGRELKAAPFLDLWDKESRMLMRSLVAIVSEEATAMVAGGLGHARNEPPAPVEMLLLPLAPHNASPARLIGVLAPLAMPYWLGMTPVEALTLGAFRHILPDAPSRPIQRLPRREILRHPNFVVYEGGAAGVPQDASGAPPPAS